MMGTQEENASGSIAGKSREINLPEDPAVTYAVGIIRQLLKTVKTNDRPPGSYIAHRSPDGRKAEERIYLIDPVTSLRWSVQRTFIIDRFGTSEAKVLESFSATVRRIISSEPIRITTKRMWIAPFLSNASGSMGVIVLSEGTEQMEPDGTKALVMFDSVTRNALLFRRIGKNYLDIEAKKSAFKKEIQLLVKLGQPELSKENLDSVVNVITLFLVKGVTINLTAVNAETACLIGRGDKIRTLHPSSEQLLIQGIAEALLEELQQDNHFKDTALNKEVIEGLARAIFTELIGEWTKSHEDEYGSYIRSKAGIFEIPPLEPSLKDQLMARISEKWSQLARCSKSITPTENDTRQFLSQLEGLIPVHPTLIDLEVTESDEMLVAHRQFVNARGRTGPLRVIPPNN